MAYVGTPWEKDVRARCLIGASGRPVDFTVRQHRTRFTIGGMRKCFNFGPTASAVIAICRPNLLMHVFARLSARFAAFARRISSKKLAQTVAVSWWPGRAVPPRSSRAIPLQLNAF